MKNQSSKRHKGKVNVHDCNGVLRIGLPRHLFPGQRKYIYLGLQDTPDNRELAEAKAKEIESDIVYERFDYTLKKYKQQPPPNQDEVKITTLQDLYYEYINTRKKTVRPGTWNHNYMVALRHIQRSPFCNGDISMIIGQDVFDWAIQNLTIDTTFRLMTQLNACFNWAIEKRLVSEPSPFKDLSAKADRLKKQVILTRLTLLRLTNAIALSRFLIRIHFTAIIVCMSVSVSLLGVAHRRRSLYDGQTLLPI